METASILRDLLVLPDSNLELESREDYTIAYVYPDSKDRFYYCIYLGRLGTNEIFPVEEFVANGECENTGRMSQIIGCYELESHLFREAMDDISKFAYKLFYG